MNTPNDGGPKPDNMELLKQQASGCGPGCSCHSGGSSSRTRWVICGIVALAAGVLVVKAMTKPDRTASQPTTPAFAAPVAAVAAKPVESPVPAATDATAGNVPAPAAGAVGQAPATGVGTLIASFAEMNTAAADVNVVFVYLPGKEGIPANPPAAAMQAAARTLEAKGVKCALFTMKPEAEDYDLLAERMKAPGVMAMVKDKGMSAVSGEITETKLVQGYVEASTASACGAGGCGPGGCK